MRSMLGFLFALAALSGCAAMQRDEAATRQHSVDIGLLIKSVGANAEAFQRQRDAIAVASQRQRNALDRQVGRQELALAEMLGAWRIAGDVRRKTMFDAVRAEADKLAELQQKRSDQARQQAADLATMRSEVAFNQSKIGEAAAAMLRLGEPVTPLAERTFLLEFARAVNADILKDQQAEIAAQTNHALTNPKEPMP